MPTGPIGVAGDWWDSIEVAPSDPQRIYVTGFRMSSGMPRQRLLFRSVDGGGSWQQLSTAGFVGTNNSDLQLAALSPTDPDLVFMRVTLVGPTLQEAIYRSLDGGTIWTKVLDLPDLIPGVVVRGDGEVWATTPFRGLYRSVDGGAQFARVPDVMFEGRCLTERADGTLFLCTNNLPPDGATIQTSTTGTGGWTRKLAYADIAGPVRCEVGTVQQVDCEALLWCGLKGNLGIVSEDIVCPTETDAGLTDAGIDAAALDSPRDKGCCSTGAGPDATAAIALLGLLRIHRRRR